MFSEICHNHQHDLRGVEPLLVNQTPATLPPNTATDSESITRASFHHDAMRKSDLRVGCSCKGRKRLIGKQSRTRSPFISIQTVDEVPLKRAKASTRLKLSEVVRKRRAKLPCGRKRFHGGGRRTRGPRLLKNGELRSVVAADARVSRSAQKDTSSSFQTCKFLKKSG